MGADDIHHNRGILPQNAFFTHQGAMSGEGIGSQRRHGCNDTRSKRVKMDVADPLLEVGIFLIKNRFVAVLK